LPDAFKYIDPSEVDISIIPSSNKLVADIKKLHEGFGNISTIEIDNENFKD